MALAWIATTMQGDAPLMAAATGGVYREFAPVDTLVPFALVAQQAATDILTVNAVRIWTDILLQIKMIGPSGSGGNYAALVAGADRIDALFGRVGPIGLPSGAVVSCYREQTIAYGELVNAQPFSHLGGLYRIALHGN